MTSQTPTADRRQAARLPVPWPLTGRVLEGRPGRLVDLSSTGTRIEGLICEVGPTYNPLCFPPTIQGVVCGPDARCSSYAEASFSRG